MFGVGKYEECGVGFNWIMRIYILWIFSCENVVNLGRLLSIFDGHELLSCHRYSLFCDNLVILGGLFGYCRIIKIWCIITMALLITRYSGA